MAIAFTVTVCLAAVLGAAPQEQPTAVELPLSLNRIRKEIQKSDDKRIKVEVRALPKFESGVEQRVFMLTFKEQLHKEFDLTPLQRQSQEWRSKCCGINLLAIPKFIDNAMKKREERRARGQVARELADVEAAGRR